MGDHFLKAAVFNKSTAAGAQCHEAVMQVPAKHGCFTAHLAVQTKDVAQAAIVEVFTAQSYPCFSESKPH